MSSYHPDDLTVDIVGIIASNRGHNCDDHPFCGEIVNLDVVVCFHREMIYVTCGTDGGLGREEPAIVVYWVTIHVACGTDGGPGREEPAIVVYWVTNGIDACCIGFLPWHMNHNAARYDGVLGLITETFSAG